MTLRPHRKLPMPTLSEFARKTNLQRCKRWAEVYAQVRELIPSVSKPTPATDSKIEKLAQYMIRGYHYWSFKKAGNAAYYLEPGIRRLVGQPHKVISVHYTHLRDDWEDDCQRAFDIWATCGFKFKAIDNEATADIIVDDEQPGAYAERSFAFSGKRTNDGRWIVHSVSPRRINVSKEWPEWSMFGTMVHEIGHALGLGHPGPYNGAGWQDKRIFDADTAENTVMSYFGGYVTELGDADKRAIELIYN